MQVWLVKGSLVRSFYKTDYTEGGHGYVYPWVPKGEIWVEHDLSPGGTPLRPGPRVPELRLMRDKGLGYDRAHEIMPGWSSPSARGTAPCRSSARKGTNSRSADLPRLTSPEFFRYVVLHHLRKP